MKLKKKILFCLILIINISAFANDWLQIAENSLQDRNENQARYWLDYLILNTKEKGSEFDGYGRLVYRTNDFIIYENFVNDEGKVSKSGLKSHDYQIEKITSDFAINFQILENGEILLKFIKDKEINFSIKIDTNGIEYTFYKDYQIVYSYKSVSKI